MHSAGVSRSGWAIRAFSMILGSKASAAMVCLTEMLPSSSREISLPQNFNDPGLDVHDPHSKAFLNVSMSCFGDHVRQQSST